MNITKDGNPLIFTFKCGCCGQEWTARAGEKKLRLTGYHEFEGTTRVFGESDCANCGQTVHTSITRRGE